MLYSWFLLAVHSGGYKATLLLWQILDLPYGFIIYCICSVRVTRVRVMQFGVCCESFFHRYYKTYINDCLFWNLSCPVLQFATICMLLYCYFNTDCTFLLWNSLYTFSVLLCRWDYMLFQVASSPNWCNMSYLDTLSAFLFTYKYNTIP